MQSAIRQLEKLRIKKLCPEAIIPQKGSIQAAGYDLHSIVDYTIPPKEKGLIKTGLSIFVPHGNYGRVAPRSGLAWKHFIDVGAGVIDSDYRGEGKKIRIFIDLLKNDLIFFSLCHFV
jgi:dUTP pyrophosphatase